jgi:signal transduction histidine kinase/ActR/RegA family two-component response regulator
MFPPQELEFMNSLLAECIETGESRELEHQVMHPNGEKWWLLRVTPLAGQDGRVWRLIGNAMPITSWKQAEEALRNARDQAEMASRTKSGFLANMSHEIRTPLNGVMGMLQLMQCTKLSSEQDEYVRVALVSSSRLTRLLSDILDISRIESGKLSLQESRFRLSAVRDAVMDLFRHGIADGNLKVRFDIEEGVPDTLVGDEARLLQILFNLVGNAIKFTPAQGRVDIRVMSLPAAEGRARLLFVVSDTGIGIPEERLKEVFEPFVQVENSFTRRFQGAGLGLAIVGRLVALMTGSLNFDSIENEGTIVSLVLPFGLETKTCLPEGVQLDPSEKINDGSLILLVEDDDVNRLAGRRLMEKCGFRVDVARDGREAVSQVEVNDYDLIFMDIQMPVMDGVEACARIRAMGGAKSKVPIIAMTAYAQIGDKEKFLAAGMNGYLAKPVRMEEMQAFVSSILGREGRDLA